MSSEGRKDTSGLPVGISPQCSSGDHCPDCFNAGYDTRDSQTVASFAAMREALRDELDALVVWQNAIHPRSDVQEGIAISISKIRDALALAEGEVGRH